VLVGTCAAATLAVALLVWAASLRTTEQAAVRATLRVALDPAVVKLASSERSHPVPSFAERVVLPLCSWLAKLALRFTPKGYVAAVRRRLVLAGSPQPEALQRFLGARVATLLVAPLLFPLAALAPLRGGSATLLALGGAALLVLAPEAVLNRRVARRQEQIRRQLADMIDLLTIGVEAGLGFEQALSRTVVAVPGPLAEEFARLLGETRIGANRRESFERLVDRTDVPELRSFVVALGQAESFGISIVQILRSQSVEIRTARRQHAQEKAQKAPVKMLFPLVFCIMPALFVVVVGPAAIEIFRTIVR